MTAGCPVGQGSACVTFLLITKSPQAEIDCNVLNQILTVFVDIHAQFNTVVLSVIDLSLWAIRNCRTA